MEAVDGGVRPKVTQKGQCPCFLWSTSLGFLFICGVASVTLTARPRFTLVCLLWNKLTLGLPSASCALWFSASLDFPG